MLLEILKLLLRNVFNATGVTSARIHCGARYEKNGAVVATLFINAGKNSKQS
jgi:hypothetical protein